MTASGSEGFISIEVLGTLDRPIQLYILKMVSVIRREHEILLSVTDGNGSSGSNVDVDAIASELSQLLLDATLAPPPHGLEEFRTHMLASITLMSRGATYFALSGAQVSNTSSELPPGMSIEAAGKVTDLALRGAEAVTQAKDEQNTAFACLRRFAGL